MRPLNLRVDRGEPVALIGSNGAGESGTLDAIAGLMRASTISIRVDGPEVPRLPPAPRVQCRVAR